MHWNAHLLDAGAVLALATPLLALCGYLGYPELLLRRGHVASGLAILHRRHKYGRIVWYLRWGLPLPEGMFDWLLRPRNHRPRKLVLEALDQMMQLERSVRDVHSGVPADLRREVETGLTLTFDTLWRHCECLAVVGRQRISRHAVEDEIEIVNVELRRIASGAAKAREELARLTLTRGRQESRVGDAEERFAAFCAEARALPGRRAAAMEELGLQG
ncbi:MAG: hypothetical protein ACLQVD_00560 [Capsulimonadaceae bacterium]